MVVVAQLVRALDCGSGGRGFEPHLPPHYFYVAERLSKSRVSAIFLCESFRISKHRLS